MKLKPPGRGRGGEVEEQTTEDGKIRSLPFDHDYDVARRNYEWFSQIWWACHFTESWYGLEPRDAKLAGKAMLYYLKVMHDRTLSMRKASALSTSEPVLCTGEQDARQCITHLPVP